MKEKTTTKKLALSGTPYDDVYRTLANDCSPLLIPVINEIFGEHFSGNEQVVFSPNEHFIHRQDGIMDKRITDSSFTIIGIETKRYLMECQSRPDNSMLVRIFEYATQAALDEGNVTGDTLNVEIPNCAVLFLRSSRNTPDVMHLAITAPNGTLMIDVPVMKSQKYSLDEIFEKKLLFLIPFYIFTYDRNLAEYNEDRKKLASLKSEYRLIVKRLDQLVEQSSLSFYYRKVILEMSEKVVNHLAAKYNNITKGVSAVMGGKVLEYETKTIFREGIAQGKEEHLLGQIQKKLAKRQSVDQIADALEESPEYIRELISKLN